LLFRPEIVIKELSDDLYLKEKEFLKKVEKGEIVRSPITLWH